LWILPASGACARTLRGSLAAGAGSVAQDGNARSTRRADAASFAVNGRGKVIFLILATRGEKRPDERELAG
jgi:hypothetical protein